MIKKFFVILFGSFLFSTIAIALPEVPSGLCINNNCVKPVGNGEGTKWNPGHYINAGHKRASFPELVNQPLFKGAKVDLNWTDLEPEPGVYNFDDVRVALDELASMDKHLFIMIRYKTFNRHARSGACAPKDIHDDGNVEYVYYKDNESTPEDESTRLRKCIAAFWRPAVTARLNALITALGKEFNDHPNFEGVVFPETSVGTMESNPRDFTDAAVMTAFKSMLSNSVQAFPNTSVIQFANWMKGAEPAMAELIQHAHDLGKGFGGPDLMPEKTSHATTLFKNYAGLMPLSIDNQWNGEHKYIYSNGQPKPGRTPEEMYYYAVDDPNGLHVNYIFWASQGTGVWDFKTVIVPLIEGKEGRINMACPENIKPCISE